MSAKKKVGAPLAVVEQDRLSLESIKAAGVEVKVTKDDLFQLLVEKTAEELQNKMDALNEQLAAQLDTLHAETAARAPKALAPCAKALTKIFGPLQVRAQVVGCDYGTVQVEMRGEDSSDLYATVRTTIARLKLNNSEVRRLRQEIMETDRQLYDLRCGAKKMKAELTRKILASTPEGKAILAALGDVKRPVVTVRL